MKTVTEIFLILGVLTLVAGCNSDGTSVAGSVNASGQAGSMSRFAISGNHLYVIAGDKVKIFDATVPDNLQSRKEFYESFDIQTLFPHGNYLLIGGRNAVYLYDNTNPESPVRMSEFTHLRACDPVVAAGNFAYSTLSNRGAECWRNNGEMDIVDISDIQNPFLVKAMTFEDPRGLAVDGGNLFLCSGSYTNKKLQVWGVTPQATVPVSVDLLLKQTEYAECVDVIARNNTLITTGEYGISLWDYTTFPMRLRSKLPANTSSTKPM